MTIPFRLLTGLIFCVSSWPLHALSQSPPQGRLFVHTAQAANKPLGELGYIDYPSATYTALDSLEVNDLLVIGQDLFTAGQTLYKIDTDTGEKMDSLSGVHALQVAKWSDKLVLLAAEAPYFRVYDYGNQFQLTYAIDSSRIHGQFTDLLIQHDRAYVLIDSQLQVVDLWLQDTLYSVDHFQGPSFGKYQYLIEAGGEIYIDFSFQIFVPRFALFHLDQQRDSLIGVLFQGNYENEYPPVVVEDKIYLTGGFNHWNYLDKRFIIDDALPIFPIAYDSLSQSLFVHDLNQNEVSFYQQGNLSLPQGLNGVTRLAAFVHRTSSGLEDQKKWGISLFPNPVKEKLYVKFSANKPVNIKMLDLTGKAVIVQQLPAHQALTMFDVSYLPKGLYVVEMVFEEGVLREKIMVE